MKYFTLFIAIILSSCSSQKISKTLSSTDFKVGEQPYYEEWTGGAPGSGSGVTLYFPASIIEGHQLESVYFRGMENNVASFTSNDKQMLVTRFSFPNTDREMSLDPKNEYGNEAPQMEGLPIKLLKDEAVIAFEVDGKTKLVKLEGITQKESIAFPGAPPQGDGN
jgi:hypothetical protein